MRIAAIVLAVALAAPAPAAGPAPSVAEAALATQQPSKSEDCPRTASHFARSGSIYQGAPLTSKKLTELPPATAYMAVHRTIDGCEVPLTLTEYRSGRRP